MKMQGKFIVFEGVEGCGKTTQLQRVQQWLACQWPHPVVTTREPGGTKLGSELRQILLAHQNEEPMQERAELFLYAADRTQHIEGWIKPQLAAGAIVLCDRYTDSTVAYQGYGRGLSLELIEQINQLATNGLASDLTLWLDVDVEIGLARAKKRSTPDRFEQATLDFHRRIQTGYQALAKANPERIIRVDASLSLEAVSDQIQQILSKFLRETAN
jgi:dTMP kinase